LISDFATTFVADLLKAHGLDVTYYKEWIAPASSPHAVRVAWYPGEASGRLDVQVHMGQGRVLEEAFAGIGPGETGLADALKNFTINSFHVLLAALWETNDESQVTTEHWHIGAHPYTAYIGNFGTRASDGAGRPTPTSLFHHIEQAILQAPLGGDVHWFRFFFCNHAGEFTVEALLDNEAWPAGENMLSAIPWEPSPGYYSVRLFLMLKKLDACSH
jgi:hypothetical protein